MHYTHIWSLSLHAPLQASLRPDCTISALVPVAVTMTVTVAVTMTVTVTVTGTVRVGVTMTVTIGVTVTVGIGHYTHIWSLSLHTL